jgi:hypothetical protein
MIEIVKAEEKHIAAIGQLWWEFMLFHQKIDSWFTPRDGSMPGFEENQVRRLMKSEDGLALVVLDRDKVIGYSLSEIRDVQHLSGVINGVMFMTWQSPANTAVKVLVRRCSPRL